jgi:hypothetical protein
MKGAGSSKMLVNIYQTILYHIPKDSKLCAQHNENLKSHIVLCVQEFIEGL